MKQAPLPTLSDPYRQKIRFETKPKETATDAAPPEVHPLITFEQDVANCICLPAESDQYWRTFRVPALTLNRLLGYADHQPR